MNLYLIPAKASYTPSESALKLLARNLHAAGIIGDYGDAKSKQFSPGRKASGIFTEYRKGKTPFEYIEFCCYEEPHFVPDSHGGNFDAACPRCDEAIEDGVVTVAIDAFNDGEAEAFRCPECDEDVDLSDLPCEVTTAIVRFAVYVRSAAFGEIARSIMDMLAEATGQRFHVLEEIP